MEENVECYNLDPIELETQRKIELEMITLIQEKNPCSLIRFWTPEEHKNMSDDEITETYPDIYSVEVELVHKKALKKDILTAQMARNFKMSPNPLVNSTYLRLPVEMQAVLRGWSKESFNLLKAYFFDYDFTDLSLVRFDFLPENDEKTSFAIPYLPLQSVTLKSSRTGNVLNVEKYIKSRTIRPEDFEMCDFFNKK